MEDCHHHQQQQESRELERLLITGTKFESSTDRFPSVPHDIVRLCRMMVDSGQYWRVMQDIIISSSMEHEDGTTLGAVMRADTWRSDLDEHYAAIQRMAAELWSGNSGQLSQQQQQQQWRLMLLGVASLQIFVQQNFTGPPVADTVPAVPFLQDGSSLEGDDGGEELTRLQKYAIAELSIGGESAYSKTELPHYLLLARILLTLGDNSGSDGTATLLETYDWWTARYCAIHQQILSHPTQSLLQTAKDAFDRLRDRFSNLDGSDDELSGRFHLEEGIMYHIASDSKNSKACFQRAKEATGLFVELTGAMGTRTKFQSEKKAQLIVRARSKANADSTDAQQDDKVAPTEVPMDEDSHLLEKTKIDGEDPEPSLRIIDQAILLSLCLDVKNNNPHHGLTSEEMAPYVARSLEHANNWMVHTMGLLIKSRLEKERSRTVQRSVLQLQVLVEQYAEKDPDVAERMLFFYDIVFPPMFELNRELGLRLMSVGAVRSALDMFEKLEMWEEIIQCHMAMENETKAQKVVEERLAVDPKNPILLCLYGDITKNPEHYERAWEASGNRFARAKRSLGAYYFNKREYATSIEHYTAALELSPLYPHSWFMLGVAAMRIEQWDTAQRAFTRVIQQEPDDGETWANLASIYMFQRDAPKAYRALQEALKHKYLNWKIWENFLFVSMNLQEFQSAIYAVNRLLKLRAEKEVNTEVLLALVKAMNVMLKRDPESGEVMKQRLGVLFDAVTSRISHDPGVWDAYSLYFEVLGDTDRMIEMRQKHVRALQVSGWDRETRKFQAVVNGVEYLVQSLLDAAADTLDPSQKRSYHSSAMLLLSPVIKRTEDTFHGTEAHNKLKQLLQRVEHASSVLAAAAAAATAQ